MKLVTNHIFRIKAKNGASVKFVPNKNQQKIIDVIQKAENKGFKVRLIIVKGRQLGGSACVQRIQLSYAMTRPNFAGFTVAHDAESVKKIFKNHVKYSFDTLPDVFRSLYKVDRNNVNQLAFENVECYNSSMTVGQSARSDTIDFLHISEAAKIASDKAKWQELLTGSFIAAGNGHITMETTVLGYNAFYDFVQDKLKEKNSKWQILFLSWMDNEEYQLTPPTDAEWLLEYKALAARYNLCEDPQKDYGLTLAQHYFYYEQVRDFKELAKQEYPFTLDEAFVATSKSPFRIQDILTAEKLVLEPFKVNSQGVEYYVKPKPGYTYSVGIDPSAGGDDEAVVSGWCVQTGEQVCEWRGKGLPRDTAYVAMKIAELYNKAFIICEINGVGLATHKIIQENYYADRQYRRLEVDETNPMRPRIAKYGWTTTGANRYDMISDFVGLFESKAIKINSPTVLAQMKTFVKKETDDDRDKKVRYEHEKSKHDDALFAAMIAIQQFKFIAERG